MNVFQGFVRVVRLLALLIRPSAAQPGDNLKTLSGAHSAYNKGSYAFIFFKDLDFLVSNALRKSLPLAI